MHKYNYIYKITNTSTKEFYIGVRSCDCEICDDPYMGSSSIWTRIYIKEHKSELVKEILNTFETRKLANKAEVEMLKLVEQDNLCINKYFDYTPDMTGTKQTPEWIEKRKMFGERNGMFGKHHSEKTKQRISEKLKGRVITEEARIKIGNAHRNKIVSAETREKQSKKRSKLRHIENIITGETWDISITEFIKLFPNENYNANSMRKAAQQNCIYRKTFRITNSVASKDEKSSELKKSPEMDNLDPSISLTTNEGATTNS